MENIRKSLHGIINRLRMSSEGKLTIWCVYASNYFELKLAFKAVLCHQQLLVIIHFLFETQLWEDCDLYKKLFFQGPLRTFSVRSHLSQPRTVTLVNHDSICGFTLLGDSPVTISNVDENSQVIHKKIGPLMLLLIIMKYFLP